MVAVRDRLGLWPAHVAHMNLRGLAEQTVHHRRTVLAALTRLVDAADMTHQDIADFLAGKPGAKTRAVYRTHIVTFYRWAYAEELLPGDPSKRIPPIKTQRGVPRPISEPDFVTAFARARSCQMRLWLLLGYDAGLRCLEIAALQRELVYPDRIVVRGKGGKERTLPISRRLAAELNTFGAEGTGWMFPSRGAHITPGTVSALISRHLRDCGIRATAHKLRHGFASRVYQTSQDIRLTQELLGHASIVTTQVYAAADMTKANSVIDSFGNDAA